MNQDLSFEGKLVELRRTFDLSFARVPPQASQAEEDLLMVRVAGDPYAIRLRDVAGIVAERKIVSVPTTAPALLGLAGIRGDIVAVFGLASILGYADDADSSSWLILCRAEEPIALGFSELEGHLKVPSSSLQSSEEFSATRQYLNEIAITDTGPRPVIGVSLVVATIQRRLEQSRLNNKEK